MAPFTTAHERGQTTRIGRYPWSRWRVDTKGTPVTLLLAVFGHAADVRFYPLPAAGVPVYAMVFPRTGFSHLVGTSFR